MFSYPLSQSRQAVMVERVANVMAYKIVPEATCTTNPNIRFYDLPFEFRILDENGNEVHAIGKFLLSEEPNDQFHLLVDVH